MRWNSGGWREKLLEYAQLGRAVASGNMHACLDPCAPFLQGLVAVGNHFH